MLHIIVALRSFVLHIIVVLSSFCASYHGRVEKMFKAANDDSIFVLNPYENFFFPGTGREI